MKKILKYLSFSFIFATCLLSIFGCGCTKPLELKYSINIEGEYFEAIEGDTEKPNIKLDIITIITKKFREPGNTPCYKKVEDRYELIEDASEVAYCYDVNGNEFEKATILNTDKLELNREVSIFSGKEEKSKSFTSSEIYEVPKDNNHTLIYEFKITNKEAFPVYIKEIIKEEVYNNNLTEGGLEKVTIKNPESLVAVDAYDYYLIDPNSTISIIIELKGLTNKDTKNSDKEMTMNLHLLAKAYKQ